MFNLLGLRCFRSDTTYKNLPNLSIPNTTNHLDGGKFSDLKNRIRVHRGLSKKLKKKVVDFFMIRNGKKY